MKRPSGYIGSQVGAWAMAICLALGLLLVVTDGAWPTMARLAAFLMLGGIAPTGRDFLVGPKGYQDSLREPRSGDAGRSLPETRPADNSGSRRSAEAKAVASDPPSMTVTGSGFVMGWILYGVLALALAAIALRATGPFWLRPTLLVVVGLFFGVVSGGFWRQDKRHLL